MNCRVCGSSELEPAIDLGVQPWCNNFLKPEAIGSEPYYPLHVFHCQTCLTAQLNHTVPKEVMFSDHTYLSGVTQSLSDHFRNVAQDVDTRFFRTVPNKCVLDIGSNDGTQLKHFQALGYEVLGVDPCRTAARIANAHGISTVCDFFDLDVATRLGRRFHAINAAGVLFHLEQLHSVIDGIRAALRDDGVLTIQFLYMKRIVENLAFDQIYHEHLLYYNLQTLGLLLAMYELEIFDAYVASIHGGSVIAFATHRGRRPLSSRLGVLLQAENELGSNKISTYREFTRRIEIMKVENLNYLETAKRLGKRVFGLGAPAKGNTLLNYFGIGTNYLDCLVERNVLRKGLYSPGMHIPIRIETEVDTSPDIYYVLAWNFKDEILSRYRELVTRGTEFYFPVNPKAA